MAQHDYTIANQGFPAFRSDLNDALAAIVSNNSGATEPTTMFAHQMWVDTAANPSILKIRNADNDAWITIGSIDQTGDTFTLVNLRTSGPVVFNDAGADVDFRVEGDTDANLLFVDASADKVGIGTSSPNATLQVLRAASTGEYLRVGANNADESRSLRFSTFTVGGSVDVGHLINAPGTSSVNGTLAFATNSTERMRITSGGNLLVGKTVEAITTAGVFLGANGAVTCARSASTPFFVNRLTDDGTLVQFYKDGTEVGSIGASGGALTMSTPSTFLSFFTDSDGDNEEVVWDSAQTGGTWRPGTDNLSDIGYAARRWDDVYATNGTIQTSDANEKQDIEALSEAETRVAVAAKDLLKKYRWKSAVAEKGDDARIHFGIIAQDLKAAFEAEGLDAGRYAMFIHSAWWETQTEVPAVEAQEAVYETQTDEEGNEVQVLVSEAVEGKDAYTRTDTYMTEAEAPEGAVRKERMGIRYNELLAFIIAAI